MAREGRRRLRVVSLMVYLTHERNALVGLGLREECGDKGREE